MSSFLPSYLSQLNVPGTIDPDPIIKVPDARIDNADELTQSDVECDNISIELCNDNSKPCRYVFVARDYESECFLANSDTHGMLKEDEDAKKVFDFLGVIWHFFKSEFNRDSYDGKKGILTASVKVHSDRKVEALWKHGSIFFGEPNNKRIYKSFVDDIEIVGHEFMHGLIESEDKLIYENQSGALNESISDIFGMVIKHKVNNTNARSANWLFGENLFSFPKGTALRSFTKPGFAYLNHPIIGSDRQVSHYRDYDRTTHDEGGVHINSGIGNYAFYLTCHELNANSWEAPAQIWYRALIKYLTLDSNFLNAREATERAAFDLFGQDSNELKAVEYGWNSVGVS